MERSEVINRIIINNNYKSYLEIGTQNDACLSKVDCIYKVGVDPSPVNHNKIYSNKFYRLLSDDFFCKNNDKFDIIFIDGMHESAQVYKDVLNALDILNKNGTIVIHDCNPLSEEAQTKITIVDGNIKIPHLSTWNGDVWKAYIKLRLSWSELSMYVVDTDQGCGVIQRGSQECIQIEIGIGNIGYKHLALSRKVWLNLITVDEFKLL